MLERPVMTPMKIDQERQNLTEYQRGLTLAVAMARVQQALGIDGLKSLAEIVNIAEDRHQLVHRGSRVMQVDSWQNQPSIREPLVFSSSDLIPNSRYLNLDGGFDSTRNRKCIFHAGLIPNTPENLRNRQRTKRGRKRFFNAVIHALRMRVERTFAWEDKFKRLLLRFECIQQRHYGMKVLAYTLINLHKFCGT
jgi:hypothetical protein